MGLFGLGGDDSQPQTGAAQQDASTTNTAPAVNTTAPGVESASVQQSPDIGANTSNEATLPPMTQPAPEPGTPVVSQVPVAEVVPTPTPTPAPSLPTFEETFGTRAVGLTFNPSQDPIVFQLKEKFAEIIDILNGHRAFIASPETKRLCSVAITEAQGAQMWAVKAITWND